MFSKSKYVVGKVSSKYADILCAVVFTETLNHSDFTRFFIEGSITSAGFCHYTDDKVCVYGESTSLRLKSKPEDEILVGRALAHPNYIT